MFCSSLLGWTSEDAPDEARLKELGDKISAAMFSVNRRCYTNQKSIGLYPSSGSADDWFYSNDANENNGEYRAAAYTIELPDTGQYGFLLSPKEVGLFRRIKINKLLLFFLLVDSSYWRGSCRRSPGVCRITAGVSFEETIAQIFCFSLEYIVVCYVCMFYDG